MAVNFRLSYNTGYDYVDLFPDTKLEAIEHTEKILKYTTMDVAVPAFDGLTQSIVLPITPKQAKAPFDVELIDKGPEAMYAYCSISQVEAKDGELVITRLGRGSKTPINLRLTFKEAGL